jgi:hypothetical protein
MAELPVKEHLICNVTTTISSEAGRVRLYCTERKRHRGDHYDSVFSRGWARAKR